MKTFTESQALVEDRVGQLLAFRLDESAQALPADIAERLRFSRERALARARASQVQVAAARNPSWIGAGQMALAGGTSGGSVGMMTGPVSLPGLPGLGWSGRLAALLPLAILVLGFVVIQDALHDLQVDAAAEVDAALLADDLPPQAYSDPGFAEFLRREGR